MMEILIKYNFFIIRLKIMTVFYISIWRRFYWIFTARLSPYNEKFYIMTTPLSKFIRSKLNVTIFWNYFFH